MKKGRLLFRTNNDDAWGKGKGMTVRINSDRQDTNKTGNRTKMHLGIDRGREREGQRQNGTITIPKLPGVKDEKEREREPA